MIIISFNEIVIEIEDIPSVRSKEHPRMSRVLFKSGIAKMFSQKVFTRNLCSLLVSRSSHITYRRGKFIGGFSAADRPTLNPKP